uniref:Ankyrin repeat family protein n=2 Tax=Tetraselmis sp. GSL018 TaxID=582737 RepID=A0A061SK30_9CHLO|eukprot:CAMPEP_0177585026 /NCGR_PEP_ID=MMETSP0419_2-20121207/4241_1 /TAXON_ID=582737 /ORGANISM="Tetraselmis sp., Strain GSL018" /LENGTH=355 /DNA_ID=CAMNT_0019074667 /DNA_START=157 /DNA_END=1224 /DNA_ORIENTATION=-
MSNTKFSGRKLAEFHQAAKDGHNETVIRLIGEGIEIDAKDKLRRTPLHMAAWAGQLQTVKTLIAAGCQVTAGAQDDMNALHFACMKNHLEVARVLLNSGLHVNSKTRKGANALHLAAAAGHLELVEFLLKRKANPLAKNKRGQTAADLAQGDEIRRILEESAAAVQQHSRPAAATAGSGVLALAHDLLDNSLDGLGANLAGSVLRYLVHVGSVFGCGCLLFPDVPHALHLGEELFGPAERRVRRPFRDPDHLEHAPELIFGDAFVPAQLDTGEDGCGKAVESSLVHGPVHEPPLKVIGERAPQAIPQRASLARRGTPCSACFLGSRTPESAQLHPKQLDKLELGKLYDQGRKARF